MPVNDRFQTSHSIQGSTVRVTSKLVTGPAGNYRRTVTAKLDNNTDEQRSDEHYWAIDQTIISDFVFSRPVAGVVAIDYVEP